MRRRILLLGALPVAAETLSLSGAGATFPQILYEKWLFEYNRIHPNVQISYEGIGSGGGIRQIVNKTVDFGASDAAMSDTDLRQAPGKILMLPMTAGAVALSYNLPGVPSGLKISRNALADIFLGKITQWNDPVLVQLNPKQTLPDLPILVVRRADSSGTTFIFTNHLAAISPVWKSQVGADLQVKWPVGYATKSGQGIAAQVQQNPGALGYVEYAYVTQNQLSLVALENKAGNYCLPSVEATAAALQKTLYPANFRVFITDPEGKNSYPIVGLTWILAYETMADKTKARALKNFLAWALTEGQRYAKPLTYTPLPSALAQRVLRAVREIH